jgi:2-dehydropantoate 2-reductase
MRIGIVGAGSIGCFVGGKLLATNAADVVLVGRPRVRDEIAAHGLIIDDGARTSTPCSRRSEPATPCSSA